MNIKVLGPGCRNCKNLEKNVREALRRSGVAADVEKVTDFEAIASYGVMSTPGLVVDEKVVSYGRVPSVDELAALVAPAS